MTEHDDELLFERLDTYVNAMEKGDRARQEELRRLYPELEQMMGCLEGLDSLAIPPTILHQAGELPEDVAKADAKPNDGFPRQFGKYELQAEIGRGGMGVVYRALQIDLNRPVALKMILSSHLASNDDVHRFYDEAKAAGGLRHPHIVGVHEVGQVNGQHYFAMDYVEGASLSELLREGPLPVEKAAQLIIDAARAIHFLHEHGIVHRDLKPGNLLIDEAGEPLVTDFGLAKIHDSDSQLTQSGTIVGTPSYMAPEQAAGHASSVTPAADVYSLGAILFEMLTGQPPFKEPNPLDTLVQVLEGEPPLPSKIKKGIPRELELICLRCLEKRPEKRYSSAASLADDLERFLKHEPVEARPVGFGFLMRRWARREPALVSRLGALLLILLVVQTKYAYDGTDWDYHTDVLTLMALWAGSAVLFQWMLNRERLADFTRFAWCASDVLLLTQMLLIVEPPIGPLLIGYPMIIAAAGMFFRVRLVIFTTVVTVISFIALAWTRPQEIEQFHYGVIYAGVLAVLGTVIAHQVYRMRVLSRYYDSRR